MHIGGKMKLKKALWTNLLILALLATTFLFLSCTITLPDGQVITVETPEAVQQEAPAQDQVQDTEQPQTDRAATSQDPDTIFLIITIVSFAIAMVSAIFAFRKEKENTAGKILFTIFIILFIVFLILYVLNILSII
jgi:uncharacterized membrane protein